MKYMTFWMNTILLLVGCPLLASGFGLYEQGVQGQGNAGAFVARAEDGSALFYNPAGLSQLKFSEIAVAGRGFTSRSFYSNAGQSTWRSDLETQGLPSFFWNNRFGKLGVGLGSAVTYEYGLDWEEPDYPGRFLFNESSFRVYEHMAGLSFALTDSTSVGVTARFADLEYTLGSARPRPYVAEDPSRFYETQEQYEFEGDDVGYTVGFQWYPSRRRSLGITYHSPIEISLAGTRSYNQLTGLDDQRAVAAFTDTFNGGAASTVFELPERLSVGFTTRVTIRTRLEVDATYEGWSNNEQTVISTVNNAGGAETVTIPRNWYDTYTVRVAGDFQHRKALLWRMGLATIRTAVPEGTHAPDFPDYDRFMYSFGVSYTFAKKYTVEAGWNLTQNRDRFLRDRELDFDPNAADYTTPNGQEGIFESQRIAVQLGLRVRLGGAKGN